MFAPRMNSYMPTLFDEHDSPVKFTLEQAQQLIKKTECILNPAIAVHLSAIELSTLQKDLTQLRQSSADLEGVPLPASGQLSSFSSSAEDEFWLKCEHVTDGGVSIPYFVNSITAEEPPYL